MYCGVLSIGKVMPIKIRTEKEEVDRYEHQELDDTVYYCEEDSSRDDGDGFFTKCIYGRITKKHHVRVIHQSGETSIQTNESFGSEQSLSGLAKILEGPYKAKWFNFYFKSALADLGADWDEYQ